MKNHRIKYIIFKSIKISFGTTTKYEWRETIVDFEYPKSKDRLEKIQLKKRKKWQTNFWWSETGKSKFITQIGNKKL